MNANQNPQPNPNQAPQISPELHDMLARHHGQNAAPAPKHVQRDLIKREQLERERGIRVRSRVAPAVGRVAGNGVDRTPRALSPQENLQRMKDSIDGAVAFGRQALLQIPRRRAQLEREIQGLPKGDPSRSAKEGQLAALNPVTLVKAHTHHRRGPAKVFEDKTNFEEVGRGWSLMKTPDPLNKSYVKELMLTERGNIVIFNHHKGGNAPSGAVDAHSIEKISEWNVGQDSAHSFSDYQLAASRLPDKMLDFARTHGLEMPRPQRPAAPQGGPAPAPRA